MTEIGRIVADTAGVPAPRWVVPTFIAKFFATLTPIYYFFARTRAIFTSYSIKTLSIKYRISDDKARKMLGYKSRPLGESVVDAVKWLKEKHRI